MLKEFREFAVRGHALDLAVAVIIGAAFGKIVASLVTDILMPPIGLLIGRVDFSELYLNLSGGAFDSLASAQAAGAATINYGVFINAVVHFLIVAFAVFLLVRYMNRLKRRAEAPGAPQPVPSTKSCPYCLSSVALKASRCPHCTSELASAA